MAEEAEVLAEQATKTDKPVLTVKIYAPFQVFYEGDAYSLSAENAVGPFDVLPGHHNFLCMLVPCDIKIDSPKKGNVTVKVNRALLHVHSDHVTVFMNV